MDNTGCSLNNTLQKGCYEMTSYEHLHYLIINIEKQVLNLTMYELYSAIQIILCSKHL